MYTVAPPWDDNNCHCVAFDESRSQSNVGRNYEQNMFDDVLVIFLSTRVGMDDTLQQDWSRNNHWGNVNNGWNRNWLNILTRHVLSKLKTSENAQKSCHPQFALTNCVSPNRSVHMASTAIGRCQANLATSRTLP